MTQESRDVAPSPEGGQTGWPQWISWLAAGFAVLSNVIGVTEVATANRLILSLFAGALAVAVGGFWLWRLFAQAQHHRVGMVIFAVNMAMMVIGAGVLGGAVVTEWAPVVNGASERPAATTPATSGQPPQTGLTASPEQSAAVTVEFLFPRFGNTFADGHDANGRVTGMPVDAEIWLLVAPLRSAVLTTQGPCTTNGTNWFCANVRVDGGSGSYALTAVVAPADVATALRTTREVRAVPPGVLASAQIVVILG